MGYGTMNRDPQGERLPSRVPREWYERAVERAEEAEAKIVDLKACVWTQLGDVDDSVWETTCEHSMTFGSGTPSEHDMVFCCYCGRELDEVPVPPEAFDRG